MLTAEICIIAAMSENRVIGKDGQIPWHISADLKRFKELTTPHPIVMGRKTFEAIGRPLPNRYNIVVTHDRNFRWNENLVSSLSLENALTLAKLKDKQKVFIIGGGEIYRQSIKYADRLYLTLVEGQFEGDTFFPDYSDFKNLVSEEKGESGEYKYKFLELTR